MFLTRAHGVGAGGDDLGRFFMSVIPRATEIIAPVVQKYGFPVTQQGNIRRLLVHSLHLSLSLSDDMPCETRS